MLGLIPGSPVLNLFMEIGNTAPRDDLNDTLNRKDILYVPFNSTTKNLRPGDFFFQFHHKGHDIFVVFPGNHHLVLKDLRIPGNDII